ncbi:MAG: hypothetical protein MJZ16_00625 [Bacteroidales bacterium]|nr:hypothetical protein [Bacteroidales bacterium]
MKKILKRTLFVFVSIVAVFMIVSSAAASASREKISITSKSAGIIGMSMPMSEFVTLLSIAPKSIREKLSSEYSSMRQHSRRSKDFMYQGVNVSTTGYGNVVFLKLDFLGYTVNVDGTSWNRLDDLFA